MVGFISLSLAILKNVRNNMKKDKLLLDKIKKDIKKAKIISFDIFDTLLVRPYIRPTDLFIHMEKAFDKPGFADERRDAERRTRIRHKELEDITFDMIYDEIDEEFKEMKQKEMDWEEMVLRANPELKQVYDYAKEQGKKIIIASDMYLPTEFIAKILRKNGFDGWDKLYVSGDIGKLKSRGSLWWHLLSNTNISANKILHIGDNEKSDFAAPKTLGIKVYLYNKLFEQYLRNSKRNEYFYNMRGLSLGGSILFSFFAYEWQKKRCLNIKEDYWQNLGYNYTGSLAYGFTRFIERSLKEQNITKLLFAARSGFILRKIFNKFNTNIKNFYIYAPRLLKMICFLEFETCIEYDKLISYFASKSQNINELFLKIQNKTEEELKMFFESNFELFQEVANQNANIYKKYLSQYSLQNEKVALIDDMAKSFSGQYIIEKTLNKKIFGYYFTVLDTKFAKLYDYKAHHDEVNRRITSRNDFTKRTWCWHFVEFLLSAPEYPIADITTNGPIHAKSLDDYEDFRCKISERLCLGAENFADEILKLFKHHDIFLEFPTIIELINSFLLYPSKTDYKKWKKVKFDWFAFGTDRHRALIKMKFINLFFNKHYPYKTDTEFCWNISRGLVYDEDLRNNKRVIRIFGIPFYSKKITTDKIVIKKCFGLTKVVKNVEYIKKYFLGIRIYKKNIARSTTVDYKRMHDAILNSTIKMLSVQAIHSKTFKDYKNKYKGKNIVLIGAGPTVKFYCPIHNTINVGLNRACLLPNVNFDYLFTIDKAGLDLGNENYYKQFFEYNAIKFVGNQNLGKNYQIPESVILKYKDIKRYETTAGIIPSKFAFNLEAEPIGNFATVSLQAIQFILYTNPQKIYIVGIDCTNASKQHFIGTFCNYTASRENLASNDKNNIKSWTLLKDFLQTYYPETEIISVNPIGLRGIFKDVYTKSFLHKHPEINPDEVEILEEE